MAQKPGQSAYGPSCMTVSASKLILWKMLKLQFMSHWLTLLLSQLQSLCPHAHATTFYKCTRWFFKLYILDGIYSLFWGQIKTEAAILVSLFRWLDWISQFCTLLNLQSKPAQARGKKSGPEVEGNCEEEDTSTSEHQLSEKQLEDHSPQPDAHCQEHAVSDLIPLIDISCFYFYFLFLFFYFFGEERE